MVVVGCFLSFGLSFIIEVAVVFLFFSWFPLISNVSIIFIFWSWLPFISTISIIFLFFLRSPFISIISIIFPFFHAYRLSLSRNILMVIFISTWIELKVWKAGKLMRTFIGNGCFRRPQIFSLVSGLIVLIVRIVWIDRIVRIIRILLIAVIALIVRIVRIVRIALIDRIVRIALIAHLISADRIGLIHLTIHLSTHTATLLTIIVSNLLGKYGICRQRRLGGTGNRELRAKHFRSRCCHR